GDIKATQGDTGHAESDMVTQVYAHILDEDRKVGAQKFEAAFYSNPDLREAKAPGEQASTLNVELLIEQLRNSPELASALAGLIAKPAG
ncbi:MAG: site-specific integrase, partial [Clostridia bacterium]